MYECSGRIQGVYPIYLSLSSALSEKRIISTYRKNLDEGVLSTMAAVRALIWIRIFRKLTISARTTHYPNPNPGPLPRDRTAQALPFDIIGTYYASSLYNKSKDKKVLKAYILLFSCSFSKAAHLELVLNLTTTQFIKSF